MRPASTTIDGPTLARTVRRLTEPDRVEVRDHRGRTLARFTVGASTVTLAGPARALSEPAVTHRVRHGVWVRLLGRPFDGDVDRRWLRAALAANRDRVPDVLAIGLQYVSGAPPLQDGALQIAGDASYGPLRPDGTREEGADFNDYLGIAWTYPDGDEDAPEARQRGCLDCSGFVRMVLGFRHSLPRPGHEDRVPLSRRPDGDGRALPRRAFEMLASGPGVVLVPDRGVRVTDLSRLRPGDLVFFDADAGDGTQVDHVGFFLGLDEAGRHRFLSSRKGADGPTMGDVRGASVLDGAGLYARAFRAVRRV